MGVCVFPSHGVELRTRRRFSEVGLPFFTLTAKIRIRDSGWDRKQHGEIRESMGFALLRFGMEKSYK